jgi:hypothetical protein
MSYPWPREAEVELQHALDIAMDYLEYAGKARRVIDIETLCAAVISAAWRKGVRNQVKLADCAINAVEQPAEEGALPFIPESSRKALN